MRAHLSKSLAAVLAACTLTLPATLPAQPGGLEELQQRGWPQQLDNRQRLPRGELLNLRNNRGFGSSMYGQAAPAGPMIHPPYEGPVTAAKVQRGIDDALLFLRSQQAPDGAIGEGSYAKGGPTALATLALLAAGAHPTADEAVRRALTWLQALEPNNTYVVAIRANVWEYALRKVPEADSYREALERDFQWLLEARNANGWRYQKDSTDWDNSVTQYGVLGIWAGMRAGLDPGEGFWPAMSKHFLETQNPDGGWSYTRGTSTANMATAGLASMFLVFDSFHGKTRYRAGAPRAVREGEAGRALASLERGMAWLGENGGDSNNAYYLYGIERAGVASGRRRFGGVDWFKDGAEGALTAQAADGSIPIGYTPVIGTSLSTLFLVYGGAPIAMQKLQFGGEAGDDQDWNLNPRDLANLSRWLWSAYERPLNWQILSVDAPLEEFDAPIVFLSGSKTIDFTDAQVKTLRAYVQRGGTLFAEPAGASKAFRASIETLRKKLLPASDGFAALPADHPVYGVVKHAWRDRPALQGVAANGRTVFFLSDGDLSGDWQENKFEADAFPLAMNVLFYATDLGALHGRFSTAVPPDPAAPAHPATLKVARAKLPAGGTLDAAAHAWRTAAAVARHVTGVAVDDRGAVALTPAGLAGLDLLHLTGRGPLTLDATARGALKAFVEGGGTVLVDAWAGDPAFADSAHAALTDLFGPLAALPVDDPLALGPFEGGADLAETRLNLAARRQLPGRPVGQQLHVARQADRVAVVYSRFDLTAAMGDVAVFRAAGYRPADARAIVSNLVGYIADRRG